MSYEMQKIRDLQERVAKLERTVVFLLEKLNLDYVDVPPVEVDPDISSLVRAGKKIDAIKVYRERTGADLKTAKDYIDSLDV